MNRRQTIPLFIAAAALSSLLSGCLSGGGGNATGASQGPGASGNRAPTISGSPRSSAKVGESYSFTPTASDRDGDSLTFSVDNLPRWAAFDRDVGTLSGIPSPGDQGIYSDVRISVSDGTVQTSLPQFSVNVTLTGSGSATLSWTPPTQNEDGTALTDLSGYRIYYGLNQGTYPNRVTIDNPGITTYVVEGLAPNTYFFVATAVNSSGVESRLSNVASKTVD